MRHYYTVPYGETVRVDTSSPEMEFEFTANLLGCLSYKPFSRGRGSLPTLEYFLKDGSRFIIGINETSVFYQGKSHALKMEDFPFIAVEKRAVPIKGSLQKKEDRFPALSLFIVRLAGEALRRFAAQQVAPRPSHPA